MVQTDSDAAAHERRETDAARSRRFEQLALPHLDAAYNLARWLCGNTSDAEDVVQEAYMRAFRFFDTFRGDSARPWLLAIVRRTWYTEWRRRASPQDMLEFDDTMDDAVFDGWSAGGADPQALLIRDEDTRLVHEALAQLPVEYREVLILRELEEMGYREIAAVADLPIGTVMSRLARGRRKLAALLMATPGAGASAGKDAGGSARGQAPRQPEYPEPPRPGLSDSPDSAPRMAAGKPAGAMVMPLRASANGRPLNISGGDTAGPVRETPDGL
ncbi:RNA polymerase sigma factor [Paraburkholderia sediminicola]|uniref:RNA polymerase sigma factor n=1 Tax=Paraburkholderia rhynchosiae TaxID=487049 RepID=A0ACC7NBV1_9BURK